MSQRNVETSREEKKKGKKRGNGRTGRQEEEEEEVFEASKKTARSLEVEKKTGRVMEKILDWRKLKWK
jgi:hypothetical protein